MPFADRTDVVVKHLAGAGLLVGLVCSCDCGSEGPADTGPGIVDGGPMDTGSFDAGDVEMCRTALPVDMLWLVDNSHSMAEEQVNLAAAFPALIETLTSPPDEDGDGQPDFPPVVDLRVGIITSDMGVADNSGVIGCPSPVGDDGVMISTSRAEDECAGFSLSGPPWLEFGGANAQVFNDGFSCLARLGTNGCGLEQQLEASLKALTTHQQAGGPHEGFLRTDSLVAIVYVTDEDDCSAADTSIFDPTPVAEMERGPLSTRCAFHPELLHPVSRYIDAFRLLSLDRRGDVIVAAITGVPRALTQDPENVDFDAVLADDRMQFQTNPVNERELMPACTLGGAGSAPPARRITEVVKAFGETGDGILASICQDEDGLRDVVQAIARLVAERLCTAPI